MRKLLRRIHYLLNRRRLEAELADELAAHREMLSEDRRAAFGPDMKIREESRDAWAWVWLDRLWQDVSYALRMFRHSPGFTAGAVAVLALGVGVNLAELHVFDAIMLHRLNIEGGDLIYRFYRSSKNSERPGYPLAAVQFYRENCSQCLFVVGDNDYRSIAVDGVTDLRASFVTGNYFSSLKVLPAWGRVLDENDARPGAPAVAVLAVEYWRDQWGSDPHVVGRIIHVNGKPVQVVGVAPDDFYGLQSRSAAMWFPASQRPLLIAGTPPLESYSYADEDLYARPRPGVSLAAMEQQLTALTHELAHREPKYFRPDERMAGERLPGTGMPPKRLNLSVWLMFFMVFLVLLSACANLGNMLLARGLARQKEIDTRIALGAGRARVVRQLLTENLILACMGAVAGLAFGFVAARLLLNALGAPPDIRVRMDWQMITAGAALALISALIFGLPPALQLTGAKHKSGRRRQVLVGVQVAVSSLLLICSGVLARSAIKSATMEFAFDYEKMVTVYPAFYAQHLPLPIARQKVSELASRLEQLPGVDAVTAAVIPPLGQRSVMDVVVDLPPVYMNYVAPNYFTAMKIPVLRGRAFTEGEQNTAIVSESAARAAWPNQDPIGKVWNIENAQRTVVGVVKDSGANQGNYILG